MLVEYKNYIFNALKNSGLDMDNFDYVYLDDKNAFRIIHTESNYVFDILFKYDSYAYADFRFSKFAPKENFYIYDKAVILENLNNYLQSWIGNIKNYLMNIDTLDEWEMFNNGNKILRINENQDDTKFDEYELDHIEKALNGDFKNYLSENFKPNEKQLTRIESKLDYLIKSSKRATKLDWKNICVSILLDIAVELGCNSNGFQNLLNFFKVLILKSILLS